MLDSDETRHSFVWQDEAKRFLREFEFVAYDSLDEAFETRFGIKRDQITPPERSSDSETIPRMFVRSRRNAQE